METRIKYRIVAPVVVLVVVFLILSQRSGNVDSDNVSLIKELQETIAKKEEVIEKLQAQHQVEISNIRKSMATEPRQVVVRPTPQNNDKTNTLRSFKGHKLVHLDLKGAAPKMTYLLKLLPVFKSWGATGLLVEYEDTFPFDGDLSVLKSHYAYSVEEITEFLKEVKRQDLLMVPLVQTFGHMEFVLKHHRFSHLRHVANMSTAIDPNNKGSLPLVKLIVAQIIRMHKSYIKYLHIGGDEVWSLKYCTGCQPIKDYLKHMLPVIAKVVSNEITPILWDDMLRIWQVEDLKKLASYGAEPMVWGYKPSLDSLFPKGMWDRYSEAFKTIWIASAFKGADKSSTNFVPIEDRIENHKSWLKIYLELTNKNFKVTGIALTGWSRYDHYATLCELLPASLPSLALCLAVLEEGDLSDETAERVSNELGFKSRIVLDIHSIPRRSTDNGTFIGSDVYGKVLDLRRAYTILEAVEKRLPSWFNHRQTVTSRISVYQLTVSFRILQRVDKKLSNISKSVKTTFFSIYHDDMINEWIWDKIKTKLARVDEVRKYLNEIQNAIITKHQNLTLDKKL